MLYIENLVCATGWYATLFYILELENTLRYMCDKDTESKLKNIA